MTSYLFFNKEKPHPEADFSGTYLNKDFNGEIFNINLKKGKYVILLQVF